MLNIKSLKLFLFFAILAINIYIVLAGYPAGTPNGNDCPNGACNSAGCNAGIPGVRLADYCYDCSSQADSVCPNELVSNTCNLVYDADCTYSSCSSRTQADCTSGPDNTGKQCEYINECNGNLYCENSGCNIKGSASCGIIYGQCGVQCIPDAGELYSCWEIIGCDASKNLVGSCKKTCGNDYKCYDCTPACSCAPGWKDSDGNMANGCDTRTKENEAVNGCSNGIDDDVDGEWDYDTLDRGGAGNIPSHGDNDCSVGVTNILVSDSTPAKEENFEVTCTATVAQINSVDAFIDNQRCNYIENSWSGSNVKFSCSTYQLSIGSHVVKCIIDKTKSYQSGADKTISINLITSSCSQYSSLGASACNNDPDNRCEWCNQCSNTLWSGGDNRCVEKGKCSYIVTANQCNAVCDATLGNNACGSVNCDSNDGCYSGKYRDYNTVQNLCNINTGQCSQSSCTSYALTGADNDNDNYDAQCGDCNDNNPAVNPNMKDICNGLNDDCNANTADGSGESAPLNSKQIGICQNTKKTCSGASGWIDNYPAGYENTELTCNDNLDNDCDGVKDCADSDCTGKISSNNLVCCQSKSNCPADGSVVFNGCVNDNVRSGSQTTFSCSQNNECISSVSQASDEVGSCGVNCCLPGGGTAVCKNPGYFDDIETQKDGKYEVCSTANGNGDWIGANCQGQNCIDDENQQLTYNCIVDSDCALLNAGECGEAVCEKNFCITRAKTNAKQTCESLATSRGYECAEFNKCENDKAGNQWSCKFSGENYLCREKGFGPDIGCSMKPNYKCNEQLCLDPVQNPCKLCYSQCIEAANDPNRRPESAGSCTPNGYWALCGG